MKISKGLPRILRIILASISIVLTVALFGFAGHVTKILATCQLGTGILSFFATLAISSGVVIGLWLIFALLFGRFYCSIFCPLGILQDLISWLILRKKVVVKNYAKTRYIICLISLGALAGGWAIGFRILEPFSNFGAICSSAFLPIISRVYNLLVPANAVAIRPVSLSMMATGLIPLLILIALVVWKKRIYCTTICPVGTILGVFAQKSLFHLRLDGCKKCKQCLTKCPASCIDIENSVIDNERCLRCMNCLSICKFDAVKFDLKPTPTVAVDTNRRDLIIGGTTVAVLGASGVGMLVAEPKKSTRSSSEPVILPPGAGSADRFFAKCTACQLCVTNCTGNVLRSAGDGIKSVHLKFDHGMCEFTCATCVDICPTGALLPMSLKAKQRCRIGLAEFYPNICVAVQDGTDCGACAEHCPTGALRMVQEGDKRIPKLNKELCIGCGSCEFPCPVRPKRAIVVQSVPIQVQSADPEEYFRKNAPKVEEPNTSSGDWLI